MTIGFAFDEPVTDGEWGYDSESDEIYEAENAIVDEMAETDDPQNSAADYARLALGFASMFDPTGIAGMVSAFTHEKCAAVVSRYSAYAADDSRCR